VEWVEKWNKVKVWRENDYGAKEKAGMKGRLIKEGG